jgi:hypothetical protein
MKTKASLITFLLTVLLFSCKKDDHSIPGSHNGPGNYRAGFVSKQGDTTWTATRSAHTETVGLDSAQDSKLKAVLLTYDGRGVFTVTATNLTTCQGIVRWNWDGNFKIDSIGYPSNSPTDPQNDVLKAGETKVFKLYAKPKPGRLKIQLKGDCGNSSELIINITTSILPITYTNFSVTYNENAGRVFIGFNIMEPKELNWVIIQRLEGKEYKTILLIPGDDTTTIYNIKLP